MTPVGRAIVAFVLVAGAGPAGFLIYRTVFHNHPLPTRQSSAPVGSAPVSARPSPPAAPAALTLSAGGAPLTLPQTVALPDSNGKMHHLADYRGHPLVLNFWATWCEPCQREIPLLEAVHKERADVQIVGVAVDFQKDVLPFAKAKGITYPLLMGEKDGLAAVDAFGMQTAFPFTIFADSKGDILAVKIGELHADEVHLVLGKISEVDAGKLDVANAREAVSDGLRALAIAHAQQPPGPTVAPGRKS